MALIRPRLRLLGNVIFARMKHWLSTVASPNGSEILPIEVVKVGMLDTQVNAN
jgi:hypothetical protein